ncbi:PREDICTED: F-box protein SKIP23-like [Fragaria vesca subsp. vesca]
MRLQVKWEEGEVEAKATRFRPEDIYSLDFDSSVFASHYLKESSELESYKLAVSLDLDEVMTVMDGKLYKLATPLQKFLHEVKVVKSKEERFDDVIFYQGKFYAVTNYGRTVVRHSSSNDLTEIASPIFSSSCDKKQKKKKTKKKKQNKKAGCAYVGEGGSVDKMLQTGVKFKVYRLDQNSGEWIEMQASDLKRRILFVGEDFSFSVSARDFPGCPESCIYFCYEYEKCPHEICSGIGVFNLDDGMGLRLEQYPPSANILMPPPT